MPFYPLNTPCGVCTSRSAPSTVYHDNSYVLGFTWAFKFYHGHVSMTLGVVNIFYRLLALYDGLDSRKRLGEIGEKNMLDAFALAVHRQIVLAVFLGFHEEYIRVLGSRNIYSNQPDQLGMLLSVIPAGAAYLRHRPRRKIMLEAAASCGMGESPAICRARSRCVER